MVLFRLLLLSGFPRYRRSKTTGLETLNTFFHSEINQLNEKYQRLVALANDTQMVYNAQYNFVPKVGFTYYLYWIGDHYLLSMIENWKWDKYQFVGAYELNSDNVWVKKDE